MPTRLLLVEDDLLAAQALRYALTEHGFDVEVVSTGRAAIGELIHHQSEVMVIDLTLPDLDGAALTELVRRDWPNLPIVLTSGHERPPRLLPLLANRQTSFLQKPFELTTLIQVIQKGLDV